MNLESTLHQRCGCIDHIGKIDTALLLQALVVGSHDWAHDLLKEFRSLAEKGLQIVLVFALQAYKVFYFIPVGLK